jgi:hypothetical protein
MRTNNYFKILKYQLARTIIAIKLCNRIVNQIQQEIITTLQQIQISLLARINKKKCKIRTNLLINNNSYLPKDKKAKYARSYRQNQTFLNHLWGRIIQIFRISRKRNKSIWKIFLQEIEVTFSRARKLIMPKVPNRQSARVIYLKF